MDDIQDLLRYVFKTENRVTIPISATGSGRSRVGLMGSGSTRENVLLVLDAMHRALEREGFSCPSGVDAAERAYSPS